MKMSEKSQKAIMSLLIVGAVSFAILSNPTTKVKEPSNNNSAVNVSANIDEKVFTLQDLSKYDGKNNSNAYIAVDGVVYDVTKAKGWKDGIHKTGAEAGKDLTLALKKSPHGKSVLKDLTVVGKLK